MHIVLVLIKVEARTESLIDVGKDSSLIAVLSEVMVLITLQENKNIKNVKRCRDGMPKSMQTRQG